MTLFTQSSRVTELDDAENRARNNFWKYWKGLIWKLWHLYVLAFFQLCLVHKPMNYVTNHTIVLFFFQIFFAHPLQELKKLCLVTPNYLEFRGVFFLSIIESIKDPYLFPYKHPNFIKILNKILAKLIDFYLIVSWMLMKFIQPQQ